jgi:hypothetical protein
MGRRVAAAIAKLSGAKPAELAFRLVRFDPTA